MDNINTIYEMSDRAIVRLIGKEIQRLRIEQNITQAKLSKDAGIDRSFLSQVENGRPASILTILQIIRALKRLDLFAGFMQQPQLSPMMMAKFEKKKRNRASKGEIENNKNTSSW